jgi:hypothetical protein
MYVEKGPPDQNPPPPWLAWNPPGFVRKPQAACERKGFEGGERFMEERDVGEVVNRSQIG